jgi:sugar lactone lactonase YvrE
MYNNYHRKSIRAANMCGLYHLTKDLTIKSLLPESESLQYRVSNCICFPSGGTTMFFCDTPTRKIYQFDYPTEPRRNTRQAQFIDGHHDR